MAQRLKKQPLATVDPDTGEEFTVTYQDLISFTYGALYDPFGGEIITATLADLLILTEPPATDGRAQQRTAVVRTLVSNLNRVDSPKHTPKPAGFPYYNGDDAAYTVQCTDSTAGPASADKYTAYANHADQRVKYFGRLLAAQGLPCSTNTWTAKDEDAYRGPFTRTTAVPVLAVGNYWDPVTSYHNAVKLAETMPNSRLLASDSWGHTAYQTSNCVTNAMDSYLISGKLPAKGHVCVGDVQPFSGDQEDLTRSTALIRAHAALTREGSPLARR